MLRLGRGEHDRKGWRAAARLSVLLLAVWLVACAPAGTATPPQTETPSGASATPTVSATPIPLEGTEWLLSSLQGASPPEGTKLAMGFYPDDYLEGSAGCNTFGTNYTTTGHAFEVSIIHRTRTECDQPPGIAEWEGTFFAALEAIASYRATEDRLEFDNAAGETILAYVRKRPATVDPALQGTGWTLTSLRGAAPLEGTILTLYLEQEGFDGYAGCNHYGGEYEAADEGVLDFGLFAITQMDCPTPEGVIEQEEAYVQALQDVAGYRLEAGRLELQDVGGETILAYAGQEALRGNPADLLGTVWQLVSMDGQPAPEGSAITLAFHDEQLTSGYAECRDYVATYRAEASELGFEYLGMLGKVCPEDWLLEQEGQYTTILGWTNRYRLDEGELELYTVRGETLIFEPLPGEAQASLEDPTWRLLAFVEPNPYVEGPDRAPMPAEVLPSTEITALFEGSQVRGTAGCNDYGAAVRRDGASISVDEIVATERACLDPADAEYPAGSTMEQEARTFEFLQAVTHYVIYGQQLWLKTADGRALVFTAQP